MYWKRDIHLCIKSLNHFPWCFITLACTKQHCDINLIFSLNDSKVHFFIGWGKNCQLFIYLFSEWQILAQIKNYTQTQCIYSMFNVEGSLICNGRNQQKEKNGDKISFRKNVRRAMKGCWGNTSRMMMNIGSYF